MNYVCLYTFKKLLYLENLKLKQIQFTDLYYSVDFAKSTLKKLKHSIMKFMKCSLRRLLL